MEPHWERGHRCHGYWIDNFRVAVVGYPPPPGKAKDIGYTWFVQVPGLGEEEGWAATLNAAKRAVEKKFAHKVSVLKDMGRTLADEISKKQRQSKW
jgi:hypothetical protein